MQISIIPGFSTSKSLDAKFHKPQRFVFRSGLATEENEEKKAPKIPAADRLLGRNPFKDINAPVLTFDAFYCDPLGEFHKSTTRFRKCKVLYFLEDDEIKVYEPWLKNSGLEQGTIVGKGRFYKPDGGYYTIDDLNIGVTLVLFGREYKLTNCDTFTRNFLTDMGYKLRSPEPEIEDPITEDRIEANVPKSYRKPYMKEYKYQSFFKYHPKTLRFYGYYGDGKSLFEEKREITLYYDLAYGTIRIVQERCVSKWIDGRKDTRVLLRWTNVPKVVEPSLLHGEMGNPTLLNLGHDVKSVLIGGKYYKVHNPLSGLVDSNPFEGRKKNVDYYTDRDLDLGVTLKIFGSDVFLFDCDAFTKNYYSSTYGKELKPIPRPEVKPFHSHKLIYKHEFGEPEQTIRTNDPFTPIRYMSDLKKFFKNDRYAYDPCELKFLARFVTEEAIQKSRIFLVRWFLEDDTMDIRSLDQDFPNSSIMEHKYLTRMKVVKPQTSMGNFERCYYKPTDMYVGNTIYVRGRPYYLMDADEYTYDYMERNCHIFHHANIKRIVTKLRMWIKDNVGSLKSKFEEKDPKKTGFVNYDDFRKILYGLMSNEMKSLYPEHALKTLARHFAVDKYIGLNIDDLTARIKTELYRMKYYDFEDLKLALEIHDEERTGYLTPKRLYYAMRSSSIPIKRDLLKSFIYKFPTEDGNIKYTDVIDSIDWIKNNTQFEKEDPLAVLTDNRKDTEACASFLISLPNNVAKCQSDMDPSMFLIENGININWEQKEYERDLDKIQYNMFLSDAVL